MVAAAIYGPPIPPQVGSLEFYATEWDESTNYDDSRSYKRKLATHTCT